MSVTTSPPMFLQFFDPNNTGAPLAGGKLFTYQAGTSIKQATWTDSTQSVQNNNPIILDANGVAVVWDDPSLIYKYVLAPANDTDPPSSPLRTVDNIESPITNRVLSLFITQTLIGSVLYPKTAEEIIAGVTVVNISYPWGSVLRYGADPTGATDSTNAFNSATLANAAYVAPTVSPNQLTRVYVNPGYYLINGTVYVRKGQRLHGEYGSSFIIANNSGTGPTFQMGWGNPGGSPSADSGGQPAAIDNLFILGGPTTGCVQFNNIAGGVCRDIFFSAPGFAVSIISANDLQLRGLFIDVHQGGISISGTAINLQVSDISFFNGKTDILISGTPSDAQFSNLHHEYNQINCVLLADSAVIKGYKFTDCEYLYNVQYGTFTGTILNRSTSAEVRFDSCAFHNTPGYSYQYGTGTGSKIEFSDCLFDGLKTVSGYAQSTTAGAVSFANESMRLTNCVYRNLLVIPVAYGGTLQSALEIDGGRYLSNGGTSFCSITNSNGASTAIFQNLQGDATQILLNNQSTVLVKKVTGCTDWFGAIQVSGANHFVPFPYQFGNLWQIIVRVNQNTGGGSQYRKCTMINVEKDNDFSASAKSFVVQATAVQGAANTNGLLTLTVEFNAIGGGANIANSNSGNLVVWWTGVALGFESVDIQQLL